MARLLQLKGQGQKSPQRVETPATPAASPHRQEAILDKLKGVRRVGCGWMAQCPAHEDLTASLSVTERDGKVLMFCHGGCSTEAVLEALGLQMRDLFIHSAAKRTIVKTYGYVDEEGKLLYEVVRYQPKGFGQRRRNGKEGWIWNLHGVRRVPYQLPDILKADRVFIVEGEKDAESLRALDLAATTNSGGSGKWRPEFSRYFQDKDVVIFPDNDKPGREHAQQVAHNVFGKARSVKVVELPGLEEHGDVSDWCAKLAEHAKELLLACVADAPLWTPATAHTGGSVAVLTEITEHFTDSGNARRLITQHGQDLRFCHAWGRWLVWDASRWRVDDTQGIMRLAKDALLGIHEEAKRATDKKEQEELQRWAKQSEAQRKIEAAVELAQSEPEVVVTPNRLDSDPWLLNCTNGTVDLRTGELRSHCREDLLTHCAGVEYNPEAECPVFRRFLDKIMGGNASLKTFLQRAVGYSLTGLTREQCVFMLYGTGANGKSTFLEAMRAVLADYARNADFTTFAVRDRSGASGDLARLGGARFVTAIETEPGEKLSHARVKQVTGGDRVTARFLYQAEFEFDPQFKLWMAVNHKPQVRSGGHAIWRRIRLVPFTVTIAPEEQDRELLNKLKAELVGILAWAVAGCHDWQEPGLESPPEVAQATQLYEQEMDVLAGFIEGRCEIDPDTQTPLADLYHGYCAHCQQVGEKPLGCRRFGMVLSERGYAPARFGKSRARVRDGLRLRPIEGEHVGA